MRRTEQAQGLRLMKFEEVYGRTRSRLLSQAEAAEVLGVSERTFRRWRDRYEAEGAEGLYDRRLGRVSARRAPVDEVVRVLELSGSGGGAVWFIRVSMDERIDGANAAFSGRHAPARAGLGSASGCCCCVAWVPAAGRPAPAPEGSSGEGPETGAAARRAVSGGGSARSAASSRGPAASRSAAAASRMARALTKGSGGRSVSAVHDTHDASRARAWSASESAWAGAP